MCVQQRLRQKSICPDCNPFGKLAKSLSKRYPYRFRSRNP